MKTYFSSEYNGCGFLIQSSQLSRCRLKLDSYAAQGVVLHYLGEWGGGGGGVSLLHSRVCISSHHIRESVVRLLLGVIGCLVAGIAMF